MSVSTEVQRTLVKSPPELWAELGNPEGLARHLGEIGEIRVTKVEPEGKVEWEADRASGIVQLRQSGWGTKVTLSLTRELPEVEDASEPAPEAAAEVEASEPETPDEPAVEREPEPEPVAVAWVSEPVTPEPIAEPQPGPVTADPQPGPVTADPQLEPVAVEPPPEPVAAAPEPELETEPVATPPIPRQGFFARLFKRRQATTVATGAQPEQPEPEAIGEQAEPEPAIEPRALTLPEPVYPDPPPKAVQLEPSADLAAELVELEAQVQQESTDILIDILDRLGAAHHRPFSRA
jgi:hypothetical protein